MSGGIGIHGVVEQGTGRVGVGCGASRVCSTSLLVDRGPAAAVDSRAFVTFIGRSIRAG